MNYIINMVIVVFLSVSCAQKTQSSLKVLNSKEYQSSMESQKDIQIIDVRTPEEFLEGHLMNAKNINFYDEDFSQQISGLDKSKPVYIYCKSGGRSGKASQLFLEKGFAQIFDLEGGITDWNNNSMPLEPKK